MRMAETSTPSRRRRSRLTRPKSSSPTVPTMAAGRKATARRTEMRIGVLGSGQVGGGIARKLAALRHDVMMGSRNAASKADDFPGIKLGTAVEAAKHGDWVVNALPGETSLRVLGHCDVDGKILIDIGNYDSAVDKPIETPLGEAIQKAHPKARVVKTLNSVSAHLMVDPGNLLQRHSVFIASNA